MICLLDQELRGELVIWRPLKICTSFYYSFQIMSFIRRAAGNLSIGHGRRCVKYGNSNRNDSTKVSYFFHIPWLLALPIPRASQVLLGKKATKTLIGLAYSRVQTMPTLTAFPATQRSAAQHGVSINGVDPSDKPLSSGPEMF